MLLNEEAKNPEDAIISHKVSGEANQPIRIFTFGDTTTPIVQAQTERDLSYPDFAFSRNDCEIGGDLHSEIAMVNRTVGGSSSDMCLNSAPKTSKKLLREKLKKLRARNQ